MFASYRKHFMLEATKSSMALTNQFFFQEQNMVRSEFNQNLYSLIEGRKVCDDHCLC